MALRSKPAAIALVQNPSGSTSYRLTATIGGRQRKKQFLSLEDAQAVQTSWECERLAAEAAMRPKITRLTQAELGMAEAAVELLKGSGTTILAAVRHFLDHKPADGEKILYAAALENFLAEKKPFISSAQHENYRLVGRRFGESIGPITLGQISTEQVVAWLRSLDVGKKTWNSYRNDLSAIFSWCMAEPRNWLSRNPAAGVPRHKAKALRKGTPERLEVDACRRLMAHLEQHEPSWCTFFALALFAGIRPDMASGELFKLARALARDGAAKYFVHGRICLTPELTKDARARQVKIHSNLDAWLAKYPPTHSLHLVAVRGYDPEASPGSVEGMDPPRSQGGRSPSRVLKNSTSA